MLVLKEALAYLICRVRRRIECGDHWVIYGHVKEGKVI
ncbi:MAG: flavin reductase family protein [Synechococcaceae cyanobacterium SM2_3_1]|nr:flavin reductase family protein [Synechococcaceae cyanobacterium SM2_3_1]